VDAESLSRILGHTCVAGDQPGHAFSLWDGLISGRNIKTGDDEIVQSWSFALPQWPAGRESNVVLRLRDEAGATRIALNQANIPEGCGLQVEEHWRDHVWPGLKALLEKPQRQEVGVRSWLARHR